MPPKSEKPTRGADAFLFVNEDFSTLFGGAKNADLDRSKQSHVQRQSFARRRRSRRGPLESSAASPTTSEEAQSPLSGPSLTLSKSHSDSRSPLPSFPALSSAWLPSAADERARTTIPQAQAFDHHERTRNSQWRPSVSQSTPSRSYSFPIMDDMFTEVTSTDTRIGSPSNTTTLNLILETLGNFDSVFPSSPITSTPPWDPFSNIQLALENWVPPLMQHFTTKMVPELFSIDLRATSLQNMRHAEHIHDDMRSCMTNPAEMYALLAASSSHALKREGKLNLPGLLTENADRVPLLFVSKAVEALRLRVASGETSQRIVIVILRMMCAAHYTSNYSAIEAHYSAALSMIQALGGLESFNNFDKERLIMHDLSYALSTGCQPRLELSWDPGDTATGIGPDLALSIDQQKHIKTGSRIRDIVERSEVALHPVVARCVPELVEAQHVYELIRGRPYHSTSYRWLVHRRLAILHRLLSVNSNASTSLLEVMRLALICYSSIAGVLSCSHENSGQYVVSELKKWGPTALIDAFGACSDLALWVVVMFSMGTPAESDAIPPATVFSQYAPSSTRASRSRSHDQDFDLATFVAEMGRQACMRLEIKKEGQLRELMRTFLFDEDFVNDNYMTFAKAHLLLVE